MINGLLFYVPLSTVFKLIICISSTGIAIDIGRKLPFFVKGRS
jgi:hypothetical protein